MTSFAPSKFAVSPVRTALCSAVLFLAPVVALAQSAPAQSTAPQPATVRPAVVRTSSDTHDRWLHVRVDGDSKEEVVRVNVPLELAEKILPSINQHRLENGKVKFDTGDTHGVDLHAIMDAVRTAKDGEFVTVQAKDSDVRVAKQNGYLLVHVLDKSGHHSGKKTQVEVKVPMKVVDALFSAGKDELDLVAALHALSAQGDTELVSVKDEENTVRVWLDNKNESN
ncbi:MAG TPA: hypothetical protein VGI16_13205 [Candidatus Acidoferrum sp.]